MMRFVLLLTVVFSFVGCAQSADRPRQINSWTAHNLIGEVRSLTLTTCTTTLENQVRVPEKQLNSVVFKFDTDGLEEVMEVFDAKGALVIRSTPMYKNGVVSGTVSQDIQGENTETWKVSKTYRNFFAREMNSTKGDKPHRKSVNTFDEKGRIVKIDVANADGSLSVIIERDYYDSGDIKSEKTTYPDRSEWRTFTYTDRDKLGNWRERLAQIGDNVEITKRQIDYY